MKSKILAILVVPLVLLGCQRLDLNPLSEGSSENWYKNENEITLALNDLYRGALWHVESTRLYNTDRWTDDWNQREYLYDWVAGSITGEWADSKGTWGNTYRGITRANTILSSLNNAENTLPPQRLNQLRGEASFFRASFYSYLVFLYGDVPLVTEYITIDQAFAMGRTAKADVLEQIYKDFDIAIENLPLSYGKEQRITKGAAYAFKARIATWMLDYQTARDAAKSCIDLGIYSLDEDYARMFLSSTDVSPEFIFTIPRSEELTGTNMGGASFLPRFLDGTSTAQPSWELFCAYTCIDGLPIDESPLFDPQKPFKNRDPRLAELIPEFGTPFHGFIYDPGATHILELATNKTILNQESLLNSQFASYNGLILKKGVDEAYVKKRSDPNILIMRYADVLLMYAEAKIELNEIDDSTLDAINLVRARAYKVSVSQSSLYPKVTEVDQGKLRKILRLERRSELSWENRRWFDLIRWRIAEIAITRPVYALPIKAGLEANMASGDYFFPKGSAPEIDENGLVDFSAMYGTGKIRAVVPRSFNKRQYLFPIPSREVIINKNIKQNPDY
ncbi:RagB/SusD family nutrient uptake outer membrane protein [Sphingobacterium faecale]|uniref:RagB/SusD family nutrient uptake outer membrane protein n=1 Tax=Sphingobacterium faecale TaxID=2803775 RepID=A0ABS1R203_9SPHI|nr:RagB/SusD family nutrient uptake outer membrane protein [Sphingobacterium faecale]MBL1408726.1 RagB/SusD family nutrient uptake outer membrane protein [Sphingobacterium faecale]